MGIEKIQEILSSAETISFSKHFYEP